MSGKYKALGTYLRAQNSDAVVMTFEDIERVIGAKLPANSQQYPAWWSNSPWNNVMTKVWLDAGFKSEQVDVKGRKLVFRRTHKAAETSGMAEATREYEAMETHLKQPRRSPLFGALKGTFTVEPGYDLTSPMYTDEEWTEVEKEMEKDWDQIEQGMTRRGK